MGNKKKSAVIPTAEKPEIDLKAAAQACFDANPDATEFYQTADGQCFDEEAHAKRHAKTLDNEEVTRVTTEEATEEESEQPQA